MFVFAVFNVNVQPEDGLCRCVKDKLPVIRSFLLYSVCADSILCGFRTVICDCPVHHLQQNLISGLNPRQLRSNLKKGRQYFRFINCHQRDNSMEFLSGDDMYFSFFLISVET